MSYSSLRTLSNNNQVAVTDYDKSPNTSRLSTITPGVFGPYIWGHLHITTRHLPENINPAIVPHIINTLQAIPLLVPCESCALHSGNFMTANKDRLMKLKTGSEFFDFTVDFHNFVNTRLGKRIISYEEARDMWK